VRAFSTACRMPARFYLALAVGPSVYPLTFVIPVRSQPAAISRPTTGVSQDDKSSSSTTFPTEAVPSSFALRRTARHWQLPAVRASHLLNAANRSLPAHYSDVTNQLSPPTPLNQIAVLPGRLQVLEAVPFVRYLTLLPSFCRSRVCCRVCRHQ